MRSPEYWSSTSSFFPIYLFLDFSVLTRSEETHTFLNTQKIFENANEALDLRVLSINVPIKTNVPKASKVREGCSSGVG